MKKAQEKFRAGPRNADDAMPESVKVHANSPTVQAREAVEQIATDRTGLTRLERARRNLLADGKANGSINNHVVAKAVRLIKNGRQEFVSLVYRAMLNGDPDAVSWWSVFEELNEAQQARVDFDDVCEASGVAPDRIMATIVSTSMRLANDVADWVHASTFPEVVNRTAKSAMRIGGDYADVAQKDREFLMQHARFIPVQQKGVAVHVSAQAAAAAANVPSVPSFAESVSGASDAHTQVQKQLGEIIDQEP